MNFNELEKALVKKKKEYPNASAYRAIIEHPEEGYILDILEVPSNGFIAKGTKLGADYRKWFAEKMKGNPSRVVITQVNYFEPV